MSENPLLQKGLEQRVERSREQRLNTARRYLGGDWLKVADTRQTYDRLLRKGKRGTAAQLLALTDRRLEESERVESDDFAVGAVPGENVTADQLREVGSIVYEAILGVNDIMPVGFLHRGSRVAHSVGRVITHPGRAANGTGFLVSPSLMLTNHHVIPSESSARSNLVQFDYYARDDDSAITPAEYRLLPDALFLTSPVTELDFTLVAVEQVNQEGQRLDAFGWNALLGMLGKAQQGERLNIIHHPGGQPQQISIRRNFLALVLERHLHYVTDTLPGSSGSPVFNEEWEVVALHHASREINDPEEVKLYTSILGGEQSGTPGSSIAINEGMRVSRVVNRIQEMRAALTTEQIRLLDEVLSATPPPVVDARRTAPVLQPAVGASDHPIVASVAPGATWQLPLTLSLSLGIAHNPVFRTGNQALGQATRRPTTLDAATELELFTDQLNSQKSVFQALAYLQQSRERQYVPDAPTLAHRKDSYYGSLVANAASMSPSDLYGELHTLLRETLNLVESFPEAVEELEALHLGGLETGLQLEADVFYDRARAHLYTWIDLREDRMLHCVYTDVLIAPEQLLLRDLMVRLGQHQLLPRRLRNNQYLNCEHIVPQSWFGKASIGVSDLHHLITADGAANNFRSDTAYRELGGVGEEGPENRPEYHPPAGTKNRVQNLFEPSRNKGIVARATLYFLICHREFIDSSKYDGTGIETLKSWARSNPPGRYEIHRNEAIFEAQGNRNPLIDFPEWLELIPFTNGLA